MDFPVGCHDETGIGIVGFERIGRDTYEYAVADPAVSVEYVYVRGPKVGYSADHAVTDPAVLSKTAVDPCVEAATPDALAAR